ncbi:MAG TPA: hypothetical protein VL308_20715 [Gemmatimonadaceae bacterium]|nr:hypothetical protein [Gemmatimonadaceae bacterium]
MQHRSSNVVVRRDPVHWKITMAIWDKLKTELDRAGKAAQNALDEGKVRLEAFRTRQLADKAAQALGYAVYRAKQSGAELDAETYARLSGTLATHETEASRLEQQLHDIGGSPKPESTSDEPPPPSSAQASPPADKAPPADIPSI